MWLILNDILIHNVGFRIVKLKATLFMIARQKGYPMALGAA